MTYVIAEPCVDVKNGACVEVCPVDCIHTTPEDHQHYIDPDICIECEQCVLVCPVEAVFLDKDLPAQWQQYVEINAAFFKGHKAGAEPVPVHEAEAMIQAAHVKAAELGAKVSVAVVDSAGRLIATGSMEGAAADSAEAARSRASVTVAAYEAASVELTSAAVSQQLISQQPARPAPARIAAPPGAIPILEGATLIGAVGAAGGTDDQDQQCSRAGLAMVQ